MSEIIVAFLIGFFCQKTYANTSWLAKAVYSFFAFVIISVVSDNGAESMKTFFFHTIIFIIGYVIAKKGFLKW